MIGRAVDFVSQLWPWLWRGGVAWTVVSVAGCAGWAVWRAPARRAERAAQAARQARCNRQAWEALKATKCLSPTVAEAVEELDAKFYDAEFAAIVRADSMSRHPANRDRKP